MRGQAIQRARGRAMPGPAGLIAGAGFVLMAISAGAVATLIFVRHAHAGPGGHGYWTDILGYRAGVDNIGIGTIVTIFASGGLHWRHNLVELGTALIGVAGFVLIQRSRQRARGSSSADRSRAPSSS